MTLGANVTLTLNVPGECGSSRPTRVEPRLYYVGIAWQVQGKCVGSAAHSPLHAIAARALRAARAVEPRPMHFAHVRALGVPRTLRGPAHFAWARAFCVGSHTLQPAHLAANALISSSMQISTHSICDQTNHGQYHLKPIPFFTQGQNRVNRRCHKFVKAATIPMGF